MTLITLIGSSQAESGKEFYYIGPLSECRECRLKGVCFNLEPGSKYRITKARDQNHPCEQLDGDSVCVVEVEKIPTPASVPKRQAIEGSLITYETPSCTEVGCPHYVTCHPVGKRDGQKYIVKTVKEGLECPLDEDMVLVDLF